jgi:hypothetical protein
MARATERYWAEKLVQALEALAGIRCIRERLIDAARHLCQIVEPPECAKGFEQWRNELTSVRNSSIGAIAATVYSMPIEDCERLARKIPWWLYELTWEATGESLRLS